VTDDLVDRLAHAGGEFAERACHPLGCPRESFTVGVLAELLQQLADQVDRGSRVGPM
jgi:hypothetical protein